MTSSIPIFDKGVESKQATVNSGIESHAGVSLDNNSSVTVSCNVSSSTSSSTTSFYRSVTAAQQALFSPILGPQNQNYYNGVYCTQPGYSSTVSVSSPTFAGFSYDSTPWAHEGHMAMHSSSLSSDSMRTLTGSSEKSSLTHSNTSHTCCMNKLSANDSTPHGSSLTSGVYKASGKDAEQHNKIGVNTDSQICFMNLTQQSANPSLTMYKCPEQVSPSSFSQINMYSLESCDFKYSSEAPLLPNTTGEVISKSARSQPSASKQSSKFCHLPKLSNGESQLYDQLPLLDLKQQDQCVYAGQSFTSESHLESYYLQGPFPFNIESSQMHYASQRLASSHDESLYMPNKNFPSPSLETQVGIGTRSNFLSDRPRSILDSNISTDLVRLDGYLHVDPKLTNSCTQDSYHSVKQGDNDFQQQLSLSVSHHMVGSQFSQQASCVQSCEGLKVKLCTEDSADCDILESVNGKDIDVLESEDSSSQESLSIAEEDDIIVEEEVEEPRDKHLEMFGEKEKVMHSDLKEISKNVRCLVCDTTYQRQSLPAFILIPIKVDSPVTSVSCLPVIAKLNHILFRKSKSTLESDQEQIHDDITSRNFHGEYLCGRCLALVERADDLEVKLGMIYQDLQCLYKKTNSLRKGINEMYSDCSEVLRKHSGSDKVSSIDNEISPKEESCRRHNDAVMLEEEIESVNERDVKVPGLEPTIAENLDLNENMKVTILSNNEIEACEKIEVDRVTEQKNNLPSSLMESSSSVQPAEKVDVLRKYKEDRNFICDICDVKFSRKESLVKHMQMHTGEFSFKCEHCQKGFSRRGALDRHLISKHSKGSDRHLFQCEQCGKRFTQDHHLKVHLQSHRGELPHCCQKCGKGFASKHSLSIHIRTHTGERPFSCSLCLRSFTTQSNLKAHISICPKNDAAKEVKLPKPLKHHCSFCNKGFAKPSDLRVHVRSHTGEKPFVCERCGKRFCNSGNYNQHARSHCNAASSANPDEENSVRNKNPSEGNQRLLEEESDLSLKGSELVKSHPFNCKVCGKGFSRKGGLVAHENRHEGIKPFSCEYCDKAFPDRSNLHNHKLLHSNIKPHHCNICGKSFRSSLKIHMRTHSGEKPYSCSLCEQKFAVKSSLTAHIKKHHKSEFG